MAMKFLSLDELPASRESDRALAQLSGIGGFLARPRIERWRNDSGVFAPYGGVFAVEDGEVIGQTIVLRLPYTAPEGRTTVTGIAGVSTRPDHGGRGVARQVLAEVHSREREAGIDFALLWTNRSWGAHRLYERLGYRDVYAPGWAVRASPRASRAPGGPRVGAGRRVDLAELERVHARTTRGRLGFTPRVRGHLRVAAALGEIDPREELLVARENGSIEGYAYVESRLGVVECGELVATTKAAESALVRALERKGRSRALAFRHLPVGTLRDSLGAAGYAFLDDAWYNLMAKPLRSTSGKQGLQRALGTADVRFRCFASDRF